MSVIDRFTSRRRGQHAPAAPQADRTGLVATGAPRRPVTAEAVRADRQDRAAEFIPAGPEARTEVFAPPWTADPAWTPPQAAQPVPRDNGTIQHAPVILPAVIFEAIGGSERTARSCGHCGAVNVFGDTRWQSDALLIWSCLACQAKPDWHAPRLAVLRGAGAEYRLACAASVVAGDPQPGRRLYLGAPWHSPVRVIA